MNNEERDVEVGDSGADKHPHRNRDQRRSKFLHQVLKPKDKKGCARNGRSLLFVYSQIRLESELVTNREHKYAVVALLVTCITFPSIGQTPVVTSVKYEASVLIRNANGN